MALLPLALGPNDLTFGTNIQRFHQNIAAITLLRQLQREERLPVTRAEQVTLAHYSAFANHETLNRLFVDRRTAGSTAANGGNSVVLRSDVAPLLDARALETILDTSLNAVYTPLTIAHVIWRYLAPLLPERPMVLEPACGTGNFIATMPPALRQRSQITAIEKEQVSAAIAALLHPDSTVRCAPFEEVHLPVAHFDLVIGNPPFTAIGVCDRQFRWHAGASKFLTAHLHDFFLAKSLQLTKPGGYVALLTSVGFLDKRDSRLRRWVAQRARLIAARRLPNGMYASNAGSESASDLVIFQRSATGEINDPLPTWVEAAAVAGLPETTSLRHFTHGSRAVEHHGQCVIGRPFADHPDWVIGRMVAPLKHGYRWVLVEPPAAPIADALAVSLGLNPTTESASAPPDLTATRWDSLFQQVRQARAALRSRPTRRSCAPGQLVLFDELNA